MEGLGVDTHIGHLQDRLTTVESTTVTCGIVPHQDVSHKDHTDNQVTSIVTDSILPGVVSSCNVAISLVHCLVLPFECIRRIEDLNESIDVLRVTGVLKVPLGRTFCDWVENLIASLFTRACLLLGKQASIPRSMTGQPETIPDINEISHGQWTMNTYQHPVDSATHANWHDHRGLSAGWDFAPPPPFQVHVNSRCRHIRPASPRAACTSRRNAEGDSDDDIGYLAHMDRLEQAVDGAEGVKEPEPFGRPAPFPLASSPST